MARKVPTEEDDVSLFPFLSIVAAIIGVLTLMIAAVTLGQMNQKDVRAVVENAIQMESLRRQLAQAEEVASELRLSLNREQARLLQSANQRHSELITTRSELESLLKELAQVRDDTEEKQRIKIVIPEIPASRRETLADVQAQLTSIKDRLALLQVELAKRKEPPEEASVSILPGGTGFNYVPSFVECTADSIVLHTEAEPATIRLAEVAANAKFVALLEKVANDKSQIIIFLLRSDSLNTYRLVKKLCDDNQVRNGKLPVLGNGRIDLTHFTKGAAPAPTEVPANK